MAEREDTTLHWPYAVVDIPSHGVDVKRTATADERQALAQSFGLPAIHSLDATFRLSGTAKRVKLRGEVRARVEQICVVTLEPFESDVTEEIEVDFAAERPRRDTDDWGEEADIPRARSDRSNASRRKPEPENRVADLRVPETDPPDAIVDGHIDLGSLAAEFLALGLDPYPRKPGVAFALGDDDMDDAIAGEPAAHGEPANPMEKAGKPSPFAKLAQLKTKPDGDA